MKENIMARSLQLIANNILLDIEGKRLAIMKAASVYATILNGDTSPIYPTLNN